MGKKKSRNVPPNLSVTHSRYEQVSSRKRRCQGRSGSMVRQEDSAQSQAGTLYEATESKRQEFSAGNLGCKSAMVPCTSNCIHPSSEPSSSGSLTCTVNNKPPCDAAETGTFNTLVTAGFADKSNNSCMSGPLDAGIKRRNKNNDSSEDNLSKTRLLMNKVRRIKSDITTEELEEIYQAYSSHRPSVEYQMPVWIPYEVMPLQNVNIRSSPLQQQQRQKQKQKQQQKKLSTSEEFDSEALDITTAAASASRKTPDRTVMFSEKSIVNKRVVCLAASSEVQTALKPLSQNETRQVWRIIRACFHLDIKNPGQKEKLFPWVYRTE